MCCHRADITRALHALGLLPCVGYELLKSCWKECRKNTQQIDTALSRQMNFEYRLWIKAQKKYRREAFGSAKLCANKSQHKPLHARAERSGNAVPSPACQVLRVTGMRLSETEGQSSLSWEAPYPPPTISGSWSKRWFLFLHPKKFCLFQ